MFVPSILYSQTAKNAMPSNYGFQGLPGVHSSGLAQSPGLLTGRIEHNPNIDGPNFKNSLANVAQQLNTTVQAPNELMQQAITGGDVDIHQVMIANAKAELSLNIATQVVTKVIQAYDRVQQIQV